MNAMTIEEAVGRIDAMSIDRYWQLRKMEITEKFIEDMEIDEETKLDLIAIYPLLSKEYADLRG